MLIILEVVASLVVHTSVVCTGAAEVPPRPIMSEARVAGGHENCVHEQIARALFEAAGDTESSRQLVDEMLVGDAELYQRLLTDPSVGFAEAYKKKLDNIRSRFADRDSGGAVIAIHVSASDVATLLLLGSLADLPGDDETHRRASLEVFRSEIGDVLVERSDVGAVYNQWAQSLGNTDAAWRALRRASDLKLTAALPAAIAAAASEAASANLRSMAIALIGRVGSTSDIATLVICLDDDRLPKDENRGFADPMEVRDLAAVTIIQLLGDDPIDYGMTRKAMRDQFYTEFGFESQNDRDEAIAMVIQNVNLAAGEHDIRH